MGLSTYTAGHSLQEFTSAQAFFIVLAMILGSMFIGLPLFILVLALLFYAALGAL
jgi:hypothetical protein